MRAGIWRGASLESARATRSRPFVLTAVRYEDKRRANGVATDAAQRMPAANAVDLEMRSRPRSRCTRSLTPCEAAAKAHRGGALEVDRATSADARDEGACRRAA